MLTALGRMKSGLRASAFRSENCPQRAGIAQYSAEPRPMKSGLATRTCLQLSRPRATPRDGSMRTTGVNGGLWRTRRAVPGSQDARTTTRRSDFQYDDARPRRFEVVVATVGIGGNTGCR